MADLYAMIESAESTQLWWNGLTRKERSDLLFNEHDEMMKRFSIARLETECTICLRRFDTSTTPILCEHCGGPTRSPYYF